MKRFIYLIGLRAPIVCAILLSGCNSTFIGIRGPQDKSLDVSLKMIPKEGGTEITTDLHFGPVPGDDLKFGPSPGDG